MKRELKNMKKIVLANLEGCYALGMITVKEKVYYLAASEKPGGKGFAIDSEDYSLFELWDNPGGVMSLVRLGEDSEFLNIENFFPVFQSEKAVIVKNSIEKIEQGRFVLNRETLYALPYAHRIAIAKESDGEYLVAGTLCREKEYVEDWRYPGAFYVSRMDDKEPELSCLKQGLTKHHGMFLKKNIFGFDDIYITSSEGTFKFEYVGKGEWKESPLLDAETSDVCVCDLDGDGKDELLTIQGFHGDELNIYKAKDNVYKKIASDSLPFGHVLQILEMEEELLVLAGSRAIDKKLKLYRIPKKNWSGSLSEYIVIDLEVGSTQAIIRANNGEVNIISSNIETGQIVLYVLPYSN